MAEEIRWSDTHRTLDGCGRRAGEGLQRHEEHRVILVARKRSSIPWSGRSSAWSYSRPVPPSRDTLDVSADLLDALELLMFGAIGMTSVALAESAATDLTLAQWRALVVIGRSDGQRVGDVGSRIGMSLPSASRLIRRLERRGYVSIERDETDRRATLVRLTDDGRRTRAAVIARRRELMTSALAQRPGRLPKDLTLGLVSIAQALEFYE